MPVTIRTTMQPILPRSRPSFEAELAVADSNHDDDPVLIFVLSDAPNDITIEYKDAIRKMLIRATAAALCIASRYSASVSSLSLQYWVARSRNLSTGGNYRRQFPAHSHARIDSDAALPPDNQSFDGTSSRNVSIREMRPSRTTTTSTPLIGS